MAGYATPNWNNDAAPAIDAGALTALGEAAEIAEHPYGVCSTASGTAAKTVTIDFSGTLTLFTGLTVRVKFTNANTASNPTMNVNGTGAFPIIFAGNAVGSGAWLAGAVMVFSYDGTSWNINIPGIDTSGLTNDNNHVPTSGVVKSALETIPRPNLLDNAYFVGGGSQQGGGQFPINQRGLTSYTGAVYGIDRWDCSGAGFTVAVNSDSITITNTSTSGAVFRQYLENYFPLNEKITASILVTQYSGTVSLEIQRPSQGSFATVSVTGAGLVSVTGAATSAPNIYQDRFLVRLVGNASITLKAAKLELGDTQTLARQVNGAWVLNDPPPNYQQELAKCQRYFYRLSNKYMIGLGWTPITVGTLRTGGTIVECVINFPVTMRIRPAFSVGTLSAFIVACVGADATPTAITLNTSGLNTAAIGVTVPSVGSLRQSAELWMTDTAETHLSFSADL